MNNEEQILKDAQYRKGASIAFFNATNSAISLITTSKVNPPVGEDLRELIKYWRDWFIDEHKTYYATVIANIGKNYDSKATIERLKTAKNIDELRSIWISLSEDERRDGDIIKEVNELKKLIV